jgi:hypothetical protein
VANKQIDIAAEKISPPQMDGLQATLAAQIGSLDAIREKSRERPAGYDGLANARALKRVRLWRTLGYCG